MFINSYIYIRSHMQVKLKPYLSFDPLAAPPCIRSELFYMALDQAQLALIERLMSGIDVTSVTLEEFALLEAFNEQGIVTFADHPLHPLLGLHGVELRRGLELLEMHRIKVIDYAGGSHLPYFRENLTALGVKVVEAEPTLTVLLTDSFTRIPDPDGPMLPVILNRFRPSIGPLLTPWRQNIAEQVRENQAYLQAPNVQLPAPFNDLARAWAVIAVFQFIVRSETSKAGSVTELNMLAMKHDKWPVVL